MIAETCKKNIFCLTTFFSHSRICVITISPQHPAVKNGAEISGINFQVSTNVNRLDSKAVGKSKKGAQWLMPDSPLCEISCSDGKKYIVNR